MTHTIYLPSIHGVTDEDTAGETTTDSDAGNRPAPIIPTGLNLGIPWQWAGDVGAMRSMLGNPGYYDWHWATDGDTYQRMIYSRIPEQHWGTIQQLIQRDPAHLWFVLNEPERADQANLSPEDGAAVAHRMVEAGARIAAPGVILTVEGLDWLDDYLSVGGPVPDAWHVHLYYAPTPDEVDLRLALWHGWMVQRNVVRPTIISEFNAHWSSLENEISVMRHMALRLRQAQQDRAQGRDGWLWAAYWFSLCYKQNEADIGLTDLIGGTGMVNELGRVFIELRASEGEAG